jgi:predicted nucleic acid-binding protein
MRLAGPATRDPVADAHLAASAIEHGATFCTTDREFSRISGSKLLDPIARK